MFGTIRKHQGWLWWIIIVVTVSSLVVVFGSKNAGDQARGGRQIDHGTIDGRPITDAEWRDALREAYLRYFVMRHAWPDKDSMRSGFNEQEQAYQQLMLIHKLEDYHIDVDPSAAAVMANNILMQFGNGKPVDIGLFVTNALHPYAELEDFMRFVRHDLGMRQLVAVVGMGGALITPRDAEALYERSRKERVTQAVFFSNTNYLTSVVVSPDSVMQYYSNHLADYRLPARRQVNYIEFSMEPFLAQAEKDFTNLNEQVEANMEQIGPNYTRIAKTPEAARAFIRDRLLRQRAAVPARQKASEFAGALFDHPEKLAELAKTNGLTVKVTEPFDEQTGPEGLVGAEFAADFTRAAFALSNEDPFAGPLPGEKAFYVITLNKQLPSEVPSLDKIRDRVTDEYKRNQAIVIARQAGSKFAQTATNALAQGKTWTAICTEARVKPITVPALSITSTNRFPEIEDHIMTDYYKEVAFSTPVGRASDVTPTHDGGMVVYVQQELPIDPNRMKADLPTFVDNVRRQREQEAFYEWFSKQMERSLRRPATVAPTPGTAPGES
jgi:hypothetical protein